MKIKSLLIYVLLFVGAKSVAQDYAIKQLENSPRHHEWIKLLSNGRNLHCFVTYPESSQKATTILLIHENRGLNEWARSMADQLSEAGYIVVAPDLISGANPEYEKTSDYPNTDEARNSIYSLNPEKVTQDLEAAFNYAKSIPSSNWKVALMGFCWGGGQTFQYASQQEHLAAALVFYGTGPSDETSYQNIKTPVYGFYGGADERVNATIPASEESMRKYKKSFDYEIYEGAGHAYMRAGDDPNGSPDNIAARNKSWERLKKILNN